MNHPMNALHAAWQAALAAEHEAIFGYGVLGPRLSGADRALAGSCADAHVQLRNAAAAGLTAAGLDPVAPQADYPGLSPVPDAAAARRLAVHVEDGCAAAWRYLYLRAASVAAPSADALRTRAQDALTASAVRAAQWRSRVTPAHPTTPFPGV